METCLPGHYEWRLGAKTGHSSTARRTGQLDPKPKFRGRLPSGRNPCKPKFAGSGIGFSVSFQESDARNPDCYDHILMVVISCTPELYCRIPKYFNCF